MKIQLHLHAYIHTGAAGKSAHRRLQIQTPKVHGFHNGRMLSHLSPHMNPYIVNSGRRVHDPIHAHNSIDSAMANDYDMHRTVATRQRTT